MYGAKATEYSQTDTVHWLSSPYFPSVSEARVQCNDALTGLVIITASVPQKKQAFGADKRSFNYPILPNNRKKPHQNYTLS